MEIWAVLSYEDEITSVDSFLSQSLWNNSLIRIMGKPVFYKNWYQMGISTVSDIIKEKPNSFLSPTELEIKYHIKVCTLTFYGITSALKTLWTRQKSNITINASAQETFTTALMKSKKPSRLAYQKLLETKCEMLIPNQQKWSPLLKDEHDFNWCNAYQAAKTCTKSTRLIEFHFRFLHQALVTNTRLKKMGYKNYDSCTFCRREPEKSLHLFWFCSITQSFWKELVSFLIQRNILGRNFALNKLTAMGLRPEDTSLNRNAINFLFLLARFFIWICRSKENIPKMESFILHLKQYKKEIEPYSID